MSPNERSRSADNGPANESLTNASHGTGEFGRRPCVHAAHLPWCQWRGSQARREAALRCEPLACGRRDPLETLTQITVATLVYGLSPSEIDAERRRLLAMGWSNGEVACVLGAA